MSMKKSKSSSSPDFIKGLFLLIVFFGGFSWCYLTKQYFACETVQPAFLRGDAENLTHPLPGLMAPSSRVEDVEIIPVPQPQLSAESSSQPKVKVEDLRQKVNRPHMHTASNTLLTSIRDIEAAYPMSKDECNTFGGSKFIDALLSSQNQMVSNGKDTSVLTYKNHAMQIYLAQNVALDIKMNSKYATKKDNKPQFTLELNGDLSLPRPGPKDNSVLQQMSTRKSDMSDCQEYFDYPVMLVDSNIDTWNWWFFLQSILHHFIMVTVTQPKISGEYNQDALRVLYTNSDWEASRSFLDAFEILFSDRRERDSRQAWKVPTSNKNNKLCFSQLLWSPTFNGGGSILVNRNHPKQDCFSSIVYAYSAYLKAALHIPALPRPRKPRILWVGRDTSREANGSSWQSQRIISNQGAVISHLKNECEKLGMELLVAEFYGGKKDTPFEEQVQLVSRANIMIGIHGAGLNMFHFLPFGSVVAEIHKGTTANKNSRNFVNHVKDGGYLTMSHSGKTLDPKKVWDFLKQAIDKWEKLGASPSGGVMDNPAQPASVREKKVGGNSPYH